MTLSPHPEYAVGGVAIVVGDGIKGTVTFRPVEVESGTVMVVEVDIMGLDGLLRSYHTRHCVVNDIFFTSKCVIKTTVEHSSYNHVTILTSSIKCS